MSPPDPRKPWLLLVAFILGPLAPWIAWLGKLRRRGLVAPGWWLVAAAAFLLVYGALWLAPLGWEWIVSGYAGMAFISWLVLIRIGAWSHFHFPAAIEARHRGPWLECLAAGSLTVYPIFFAYGFLGNLTDLLEFSVHMPAAIYTESLVFSLAYGTPVTLLVAVAIRWAGWKPGPGLVARFYSGAVVTLIWIAVWERMRQFGLERLGAPSNVPLLFEVFTEAGFRDTVRNVFYVSGAVFSLSYLVGAGAPPVFVRRAVYLGMPVLLGTINLNLVLGESGYFLAGLRERMYRADHYRIYRLLATVETLRLPRAFFVPFLMRDLAELEYLQGDKAAADRWHARLGESARGKPFYAPLLNQTEWGMETTAACSTRARWLPLPRIRAAESLDADWYGLLGAVSFFHPEWGDFDLKQKLLEVSPFVQLEVPRLGGVPAVAEALDVFGLPFTTCFLDSTRLRRALRNGRIPLIAFEGRWIPLVGWDECRRGYLIYRHPDTLEKNPWFQSTEKEAVFGKGGGTAPGSVPYSMLGFLPERLVLRNLHDIGGIALVLGDSAFTTPAENRAAYLVEFGDVLYQQHADYKGAAAAYVEAQALHPSDYHLARMVHLERLQKWSRGPDRNWESAFHPPESKLFPGLSDSARSRITGRILRGEIGQYLLMNWHQAAPRFQVRADSALRDSSRALFHAWLKAAPNNPAALDSLAMSYEAVGRWDSAAVYYRRMLEYFPLGNEPVAYRLAWCLFRLEQFDELPRWLRRCETFHGEAKHRLMTGVRDWQRGRKRVGLESMRKSLKLDKSLPETHAWLERVAQSNGDSSAALFHRRWRERTLP